MALTSHEEYVFQQTHNAVQEYAATAHAKLAATESECIAEAPLNRLDGPQRNEFLSALHLIIQKGEDANKRALLLVDQSRTGQQQVSTSAEDFANNVRKVRGVYAQNL